MSRIELKTGQLYFDLFHRFEVNKGDIPVFLRKVGKHPDLFRRKKCFDAGCGYGRTIYSLMKLGADYCVGVDIGKVVLSQAKRNTYGMPVFFIRCDLLHLPIRENIFDYTHCNGVLHHTSDPEKDFENCRGLQNLTVPYF